MMGALKRLCLLICVIMILPVNALAYDNFGVAEGKFLASDEAMGFSSDGWSFEIVDAVALDGAAMSLARNDIVIVSQEEIMLSELDSSWDSTMSHMSPDAASANLPDIGLLNFTNPAGTRLPANTTIEYTFDIGNYGDAATPSIIPVNVYMDNTLLGTAGVQGPIQAGYGLHVAIALNITSIGNRTIRLHGNPSPYTFAESNYNNNTVSQTFTYLDSATAVDVAAYYIQSSSPGEADGLITAGEPVTFQVAVANYSQRAVNTPVQFRLNNQLIVSETVPLSARVITLLEVTGSFSQTGSLMVTLEADPNGITGDWNMTNNILHKPYTLVAPVPGVESKTFSDTALFATTAYNGVPPIVIGVPVAIRVNISGSIDYRETSGNAITVDKITSGILYKKNIHNPEVCTYECELGAVTLQSGGVERVVSLPTREAIIRPTDYTGELRSVSYPQNTERAVLPVTLVYRYECIWSGNCVPITDAGSYSLYIR